MTKKKNAALLAEYYTELLGSAPDIQRLSGSVHSVIQSFIYIIIVPVKKGGDIPVIFRK